MATRTDSGWPDDMCDLRAAETAAAGQQSRKAAQGGEDNQDPEDECE
ncbi:hypothetical protein [Amycolatopsis taiwanensis]|nr:hypothetical protein [Amycolatopsis taiwanensis]